MVGTNCTGLFLHPVAGDLNPAAHLRTNSISISFQALQHKPQMSKYELSPERTLPAKIRVLGNLFVAKGFLQQRQLIFANVQKDFPPLPLLLRMMIPYN